MRKKLNKLIRRPSSQLQARSERITSDNMAEHREEVLGRARRFIYPLQHSKHRLVVISVSLLLASLVIFMAYCALALYKFKDHSGFLYQVTKVVPFPVARIGSDFVAYENYLFEVERYTHYYETQQDVDFNSENGARQLAEFKKRALNNVINDAYVREIAAQKGIGVSEQEVDQAIEVFRSQNRLGSSDRELESVLRDFWDWSVDDFRRSLKQELLNKKVVADLDTEARAKAEDALAQLRAGEDFAKLAHKVSEDPSTKNSGGEFGFLIDEENRDISPDTVQALFSLQPGEFSDIINIGYGLEIVKNIEQKDGRIRGAHIVFNFKDIDEYLKDVKDQTPPRTYISL